MREVCVEMLSHARACSAHAGESTKEAKLVRKAGAKTAESVRAVLQHVSSLDLNQALDNTKRKKKKEERKRRKERKKKKEERKKEGKKGRREEKRRRLKRASGPNGENIIYQSLV